MNQLARQHPQEVADLVKAGDALRKAQRDVLAGKKSADVREASRAQPGIRRVVARHVPTANVASRRVLERAGFVLERADEQHTWYALSQPG